MDLDLAQLRALSAVVAEGTLEAAARALHVTPSAVSQRLKALEAAAGRVLLVRSKPARVTESGAVVLRLARQLELISADAGQELGLDESVARSVVLPIAVNADSLATWVLPALAPIAGAVSFQLQRDDQAHTSALLREGAVMAAITADAEPVPGCSSVALGNMRYRPTASRDFIDRWFPAGFDADVLATAPMVIYDRKDDLQHRYLQRRLGGQPTPPVHHIPASGDFVTAVRLGFGWGMLPDLQIATQPAGRLVDLDPAGAIDIPLYWQQWKLRSPSLDRVAQAVRATARIQLTQTH